MSRDLDHIDRRILNELQAEGRLSIVDLASRINLTKTPCSERVRRLERSGIIVGYRAILNGEAINRDHITIVHVSMSRTNDGSLQHFNDAVKMIPEVETCLMIAGSFDYMLKVRTRNMAHFRELLGERISKLPDVIQTHSYAVMETVKESTTIPMLDGVNN